MTILNPDEGREGGRAGLYTPDTLAERWGCSKAQVVGLVRSGKLRAFSVGTDSRHFRIRGDEAEHYAFLFGTPRSRGNANADAVIYFILCGAFVKIGKADDVADRLKGLQTASPHTLELLATEPGHFTREAELHEQFKNLHHRGEWFRYEGELVEYIAGLPR